MQYLTMVSDLMPKGEPKFLEVVKFPKLEILITQHGRLEMLTIVALLVKDFCSSVNVVRNMNEDQIIEAANMLLDECGNFRLEDYVMMFQMAKKGQLVEIRDRVDIQLITKMLDEYWKIRNEAAEKDWDEKNRHFETLGNQTRVVENYHSEEQKMISLAEGMQAAFGGLKQVVNDKIGSKEERQRLKEIEQNDTEAIRKKQKDMGYESENEAV